MSEPFITLGPVYERPDGYAITVWRGGRRSACCNSGHDTAEEAQAHGDSQVRSYALMFPEAE